MIIPNKKKKIRLGSRIRKTRNDSQKNLFKDLSSKQIQRPVIKNQIIKKLTSNLQTLWNQKNIPEPQRETFMQIVEKTSAKKQSSIIAKEIESYKNNKNPAQLALRAITAREHSLVELHELVNSLELSKNSTKHSVIECLLNLRMLTIHVVECIQTWKKTMNELAEGNFDLKFL